MKETTTNNLDLGFATEEFRATQQIIPYAQFLNPYKSPSWGIAIKKNQAEIAGFVPDRTWIETEHKFKGSDRAETLYLSQEPRLLILNRSRLVKSSPSGEISLYNHAIDFDLAKNWKKFTYAVIWFLGEDNKPLSTLPFRLRISGQAGMSFINHYRNYTGASCFCGEFFKLYKELNPADRDNAKNDLFWAHAIYAPKLAEKEAKSKLTGESSEVCMTVGFLKPTKNNFFDLIVSKKANQELSDRILEQVEKTKAWINIAQMDNIKKEKETSSGSAYSNENWRSDFSSSNDTITDKQGKRLFAIARLKKIEKDDYSRYLNYFGYDSETQIKKEDYKEIVDGIENDRYLEILKNRDNSSFDDLPF